ncbi:sulfatase [Fodinisporobacter ferrooxydans]|uniref:Sulfatase n=1 Tax=Fodinisporobacter ferrooxydans TaxID=2901836 RepID=A0ABY4CE26_9BACL|nr:sulfatase [Alicyclobacillaceae bacterium MYW30-H2]
MNVVLLLVDTLRYDFMGFNGNKNIQTPNMDRLAKKSIVFDNAFLGSYPCMPARRDILTGRYEFPWRGWGPLEHDDNDLTNVITLKNKHTSMLITDHFHLWEKGSGNYHFNFSGYEFIRGQEYDKWKIEIGEVDYPAAPEKLAGHCRNPKEYFERNRRNGAFRKNEADYFPAQVMMNAANWLENNRKRENFFLMIDCFDPHEPFDPPKHYIDLYDSDYKGEEVIWPTYGWNTLSEEETCHVRSLYAAELSMTDRWIGYLLDKMEQLGLMENTMIIFTTDHGHMFGEHNLMGKPWSAISDSNMYQEVAHIPMVIYHPEIRKPGKRVSQLVQPVDIYPTVLDAFGIEHPDGLHGKSLIQILLDDSQDSQETRKYACFGRYGEAINITDGEWTLFLWPSTESNSPLYWYSQLPPQYGPEKAIGGYENGRYPVHVERGTQNSALYNIKEDYRQTENLIDKRPDVAERLKKRIVEFLEEIDAPEEQLIRLGLAK